MRVAGTAVDLAGIDGLLPRPLRQGHGTVGSERTILVCLTVLRLWHAPHGRDGCPGRHDDLYAGRACSHGHGE